MAIKLDMSKAYDRVECDFLKWILTRPHFPSHFIFVNMIFVNSVSFHVLNGFLTRSFNRGED